MLDGTAINGFFWVFFASLTNLQYDLVVTDTATGSEASYNSPLGTFTSINDTSALPEIPPPLTAEEKGEVWPSISDWSSPDTVEKGAPPGSLCNPSPTTLCLDNGRFQVEVAWENGQGGMGDGFATPLTDFSGHSWFFAPSNIELAVRILDGGDGNFWFYYGATTNVEYTITVTEICSGQVNTYFNPLGNLTSSADFEAFPSGPPCGIFVDGFESGDTTAWSNN